MKKVLFIVVPLVVMLCFMAGVFCFVNLDVDEDESDNQTPNEYFETAAGAEIEEDVEESFVAEDSQEFITETSGLVPEVTEEPMVSVQPTEIPRSTEPPINNSPEVENVPNNNESTASKDVDD